METKDQQLRSKESRSPNLLEGENFVCNNLGGTPYGFTDAIYWKGNVYALQTNKSNLELRLIRMTEDTDNASLKFSGEYEIVSGGGGRLSDASLVIWYDSLYVFWKDALSNWKIWHRRYNIDADGKLVADNKLQVKNVDHAGYFFETVVFNNQLWLAYLSNKDHGPYRMCFYICDSAPGENGELTFDNETFMKINGNDENFDNDNSDSWAMTVWYGNTGTNISGQYLIIGRAKDEELIPYLYDGETWHKCQSLKNVDKGAYSLKLLQADVDEMMPSTDDSVANPLLFIYSSPKSQDIMIQKYFPNKKTFSTTPIHTGVDDGWMGVTTSCLPVPLTEDESSTTIETDETVGNIYRQYIQIISGYETEKNYATTIRSNLAKTINCTYTLTFEDTLDDNGKVDSDLRSLIRLILVVEGPPPTPICHQKDIDAVQGDLPISISTLSFRNNESSLFTSEHTVDFAPQFLVEYKSKMISKKEITGSLGYHFVYNTKKVTTVDTSIGVKLYALKEEDLSQGELYYSCPVFFLQQQRLYTPDGTNKVPCYPVTMTLNNIANTVDTYMFPLSSEPVKIDYNDFSSWQKRYLCTELDELTPSANLTVDMNVPQSLNTSIGNKCYITSSMSHGVTAGLKLLRVISKKHPKVMGGFQVDFSWDYNLKTGANMEKGVAYEYAYIDPSKILEVNPKKFSSSLYILHTEDKDGNGSDDDGNSRDKKTAELYYKSLCTLLIDGSPAMLDDESPVILAWRISSNK